MAKPKNPEIKFVPNKYTRMIPYSFSKAYKMCVFAVQHVPQESGLNKDVIQLAIHGDITPTLFNELKRKLKQPIAIHIVTEKVFNQLIADAYSSNSAAEVVDDIQDNMEDDLIDLMQALQKTEDLLESENDAPIIRMINAFFTQSVKEDASDIHLDPYENQSVIRFRKDGCLFKITELNSRLHAALVSRIKIMANLDIAEKRLPQDGRISLRVAGKEIDLRISTIPTAHGERIVMRLLDKNKERLQLESLGMRQSLITKIDELIARPNGIFLVTGPTGSGKSTTLYASLARIDNVSLNIMTVEDPVEYDITGISQTQVNGKIDMTFARALRAILRQDPDVVMIGEIRDLETAQIAVQASLTGHLVLATLHTNSAVATVTRLIDMGVEPFLLSSSIVGILAQRLMRLLCNECKEPMELDEDTIKSLGLAERHLSLYATTAALAEEKVAKSETSAKPRRKKTTKDNEKIIIYTPQGCPKCSNTGYKGRSCINELLFVDSNIQKLIHDQASEMEIKKYAQTHLHMESLRDDAIRLLLEGKTSMQEVISITYELE